MAMVYLLRFYIHGEGAIDVTHNQTYPLPYEPHYSAGLTTLT